MERFDRTDYAEPPASEPIVYPDAVPSEQPLAPAPPPGRMETWGPALRELIETILLTLVIFVAIRFAVENYRIEGSSMEPNFHDGQFLLVNKVAYRIGHPAHFDVIIFKFPLNTEKNYIKRVIGVPGDKVQVLNGRVFVNDQQIEEPFNFNHADYNWGPQIVPTDSYFVLGDNRPESSDSHFWGMVPTKDIVGKAWVSYWPPDLWGLVPDYSYAASP